MIHDAIFSDRSVLRRCGLRPPLRYFTPREDPAPESAEEATLVNGEALVTLSEIDFGYTDDLLFDGLDMTISRGEILGLVGPSGSGKSTLAQLLCNIYKPQAGKIDWSSGTFPDPDQLFGLGH